MKKQDIWIAQIKKRGRDVVEDEPKQEKNIGKKEGWFFALFMET